MTPNIRKFSFMGMVVFGGLVKTCAGSWWQRVGNMPPSFFLENCVFGATPLKKEEGIFRDGHQIHVDLSLLSVRWISWKYWCMRSIVALCFISISSGVVPQWHIVMSSAYASINISSMFSPI